MPIAHRRSGPPLLPVEKSAVPAPLEWRLVYPTGHGRRSLIVDCHRTGGGFTIRLPEFNVAANYLSDAPVALTLVSADGFDANAVITGRSHAVDDQAVDLDAVSALERWPDGVRARYFLITPTHLRHRRCSTAQPAAAA